MSRKYSIDEIDQMREALVRKHSWMAEHHGGIGNTNKAAETELRTLMQNGTEPDELLKKYPPGYHYSTRLWSFESLI